MNVCVVSFLPGSLFAVRVQASSALREYIASESVCGWKIAALDRVSERKTVCLVVFAFSKWRLLWVTRFSCSAIARSPSCGQWMRSEGKLKRMGGPDACFRETGFGGFRLEGLRLDRLLIVTTAVC